MNFKGHLTNKKQNTTHITFLVISAIFLAFIAYGLYSFYSDKYQKKLIKAHEEVEHLAFNQLEKLITHEFNHDQGVIHSEIIENFVKTSCIHHLLITNEKQEVLLQISSNDVAGEGANELTKELATYHSSDLFHMSETIQINPSQTINIFCDFSRLELNSEIKDNKTETALISIAFFIISILALFITSFIIIVPLQKISSSVVEISSGNFSKRIDLKKKNEFSGIASSVNILAENLTKANNQVEKLNKELKFQFRDKIGELNYEINQRRQAEYSLKQSEEQFRLLFEQAPIGMVISSIVGKILKVNAAFHSALGYTESEILEKKIKDLTFLEDQNTDAIIQEKLVEGIEQSAYYEKRMVRKDGEIIYVIVEAVLVKNKEGRPSHVIEQVIDITERKRVEKELIFAKERAEESDRLKSAFLAQMSHEIRTPLNVILTAMSLIQDELDDTDDDTKVILESVSSAGKRLQRTIDLILNISAVQSGSYSPQLVQLDLDKELMALLYEFKTIANEKGLRISYLCKAGSSIILADHYSVVQVFQNLIDNAIKYTLKGNIEIILDDIDKEKLQVVVRDSGIGISKDYIANLFSPFSQEDVGHKREFEGNGLGLALVKKYVEINNAEILVESVKDKGSTFTVIFNKKPSVANRIQGVSYIGSENAKQLV